MKTNKAQPAENKPPIKSTNQFPVVGIGASAGGLEAFKKLLKAIPENSGMAYVLVQHLDPQHQSLLPELLQKVTPIPVLEISENIKVKPNHIYIIPSNKMLLANDGILQLKPRPSKTSNERHLPIDLFFASLAEVHQSHAIGVVLSGTGSDGAHGLKVIKEYGGITFAQDEASAAYEGMPHSAVQANVVDFILAPEKIPEKLLEITGITNGNGANEGHLHPQDEELFTQILSLIRIRKGADFTYYKPSTIRRRILRRMALNKNEAPSAYLNYLRENKAEQDILFLDLLIPVTSFFRDAKVFDNLCETVFPLIVQDKTPGEPIRVWVAGCSTGQEAYSIAICLKEFLGDAASSGSNPIVQIFATDISTPAIVKARIGIYTKSETEGVTPQRLKEFFTKTNGSYQINKQIRDMCIFAVHNFLKDPPFGKIDFISCRNVLIYMEPHLQKKALTTFHYALAPRQNDPDGQAKKFLLLGKSETVSSVPDLFTFANKNDKLFGRKDAPGKFMHTVSLQNEQGAAAMNTHLKIENIGADFQKTADDIMLNKYSPAGVVVNEEMDIVQFRGSTGAYLEPSPGKPSLNILKMVKDGMAFELRNILHKAKKDNAPVTKENIPVQVNGSQRIISIEAIPLPNIVEPHYLILFHDKPTAHQPSTTGHRKTPSLKTKKDEQGLRILQLEQELAQSREDMRSITEDQEAANEELQSANEELLSGSEELQSLNEELETSKEELQSTNEELTVVNQEMIGLNELVTEARDYAEAIITTLRQPLLVLDKNLRVKSANHSFYTMFQVNEQQTQGVLIYDLGNKQWKIHALKKLLEEILPQKITITDFEVTHDFPTIGTRVMLLNACKMARAKEDEQLILLVIEDITERNQAKKMLQQSEAFNKSVLESSPDCINILDAEGRLQYMNSNGICLLEMDDFTQYKNKYWWDFWEKENQQTLKDAIAKARNGEKTQFQAYSQTAKGTPKWWDVIVLPVQAANRKEEHHRILSVSRDITEAIQYEIKEKELLSRFKNLVIQAPVAICVLRGENYLVEVINEGMAEMWDRKVEEVLNKPAFDVLPELKEQGFKELLDNVYNNGERFVANELPINLKRNGKLESAFVKFVYEPLREGDGTVSGVMALAHEITGQVIARKKMEAQALMVQNLLLSAPAFICTLRGPTHVYELVNTRYQALFGKRKIQGKPIMEALPELEGQGFETLLDKVYLTGEPYVGVDIPVTLGRDENSIPTVGYFNFSYQPMYDEDKQISSILVFGYETTEQVIAKNKNLQSQQIRSKELEVKVNQRTIELKEANEGLLKMNNELQAFTYISSHDLQEPLRKIKTFAKLIVENENQRLSDKGKDYLSRLHNATIRMQTLIEDLLAYSRVNIAERKFAITRLDHIVDDVINELADTIQQKNAILEVEMVGEASVNPSQFRQLMNNLIGNALKFSDPGIAPHIIITSKIASGAHLQSAGPDGNDGLEKLSPEINYCHISVADNGIGFDPQYKERIFEVFQRLYGKDEYPGTGIGLAIVKKIVENHYGIIAASSELGKGARFDIYIPAK